MVQRASVQQQTVEHGHVRGFVSGQVYDSIRYPKILRVTEHAQTVCTRPFLLPSKGLGTRLCKLMQVDKHFSENVLLSMEKLIKYVCLKGKFCAYSGDSRKSS